MKVKDVMTANVVTAIVSDKITKIAEIMSKNRFHALPVVENNNEIVGIVTEDDFFTRGSKIIDSLTHDKSEESQRLMNLEVKDIMSKECVTIMEEMDVSALIEFFRESRFSTLPVVNSSNRLVGIVTLSDILGLIKAEIKNKIDTIIAK